MHRSTLRRVRRSSLARADDIALVLVSAVRGAYWLTVKKLTTVTFSPGRRAHSDKERASEKIASSLWGERIVILSIRPGRLDADGGEYPHSTSHGSSGCGRLHHELRSCCELLVQSKCLRHYLIHVVIAISRQSADEMDALRRCRQLSIALI